MEGEQFIYFVTLLTFGAIFLLCYINKKFAFLERNQMSRASNPKFPFGNVHNVIVQEIPFFMHLWKYYNKFKRRKCRTGGGFYVFVKPAILLVNTELIDTVLSAQNSQYLQEWRERRSSDLNDELGNKILNSIIGGFLTSWPSLTQSMTTEEVNVTDVLSQYVVEVSATKFFCAEAKNEEIRPLIEKGLRDGKFSNFWNLLNMCYGLSRDKKAKQFCKIVENIITKRSDEKKNDILGILLDRAKTADEMAEFMFAMTCNLKIAVNLILLLLYELSNNKEIQEDLRGEITRFKKSNKINAFIDLNELAYLKSVIGETLRKYPVEPFVCKMCKKNFKQTGLNFPEDVLVFVSVFGIHHDVQNYTNPELFDPDRFAEENDKFFNPSKYLPFGRKNKNDFDARFIVIMMKLMVMDILTNIKQVSLGKRSPKSLRFDEASLRLKPKDDMWLKIEKL